MDEDYPEQLELDLGIIPPEWDDNTRYSNVYVSFSFFSELSTHQFSQLLDEILDVVDAQCWPDFVMSASIKSGTDRELFPEGYKDEGEESNTAGEKEV